MKKCIVCKKLHNNKQYCSHPCRNLGASQNLCIFNKNRIGKTYADFFGEELAKQTQRKQSKATSKYNKLHGIIPPSRKGIKSIMPLEFFQRIGAASAISQSHKKGYTSIEKKLYKYLELIKIDFNSQYLINNHFVVDTYIPKLNLVIEADGNYWHSLDKNKKADKSRNAYLLKCGYKLIRLTETEINNNSFIDKLLCLQN